MKWYLLLALILFAACTQTVAEVSTEEHIGETVKVKGIADNSIKIGDLSGYTLTDKNGDSILVSSSNLPEEGKEVTIKGTLSKKPILGYIITVE